MLAKDVMQTRFHTLRPHNTIAEAVQCFHSASKVEGQKVFGLMVTDDNDQLVGMLSMYDILLFMHPKHAPIWGEMEDLDPSQLYAARSKRVQSVKVGDIMTPDVVTIGLDTHLMVIADVMIKKHIRRLPVVAGKDVVGIVYVSDVFYQLLRSFLA